TPQVKLEDAVVDGMPDIAGGEPDDSPHRTARGGQAGASLCVALHALEHGQGMLVALCKGSLEAVELCDLLPGRSERGDLLAGGREPRPGHDRGIRVWHLGPGGLDDLSQLLVGVAEPCPDLQPREVTQVVLDG